MSLGDLVKQIASLTPEKLAKLQEVMQELENKQVEEKAEEVKKTINRGRGKKRASKKSGNKFEQSPYFDACKDDIEADKKLWANQAPSERGTRRVKTVKVKCMTCGKLVETDPSMVFYMSKTEYSFNCEQCQKGGR